MAARRVSAARWFAGGVAAALALLAGVAGWRWWTERYTVAADDRGAAVTQVIAARLRGTSELKVAALTGTVQASAADTRLGGLLTSDQVVKAPFSVDYLVDLRRFGARDLHWDAAARRLTVDAPPVEPQPPNIDLAHRYLVRTRGLLVTRGAGEELGRRTALGAVRAAADSAATPAHLAQARASGRRALARLLAAPLAAAGLGSVTVVVRYPDERGRRNDTHWDVSRSPAEVLADPH